MAQRSVRFPEELEAAAVALADSLDRPFSWVVVRALEKYVASHPQLVPSEAYERARREARPQKFPPDDPSPARGSVRAELEAEFEPEGGCPECGGQWTRRVGVPGRFCVDCGGQEQS